MAVSLRLSAGLAQALSARVRYIQPVCRIQTVCMSVNPTKKAERSEATRAALIAVARRLFAERGFADTATEEIVRQAGVTRGALYHHFRGKEDLFRAVFEQVGRDMVRKTVEAAAGQARDPWERFVTGCRAFLEAAMDPGGQRICLIDGPAVLGWDTWREIDSIHGLGVIRVGLEKAMELRVIDRQPVDPLAHMILAALNEGAMVIARAADPQTARRDVEAGVVRLLEGLRAR